MKDDFHTIYQLSCFVGHPVCVVEPIQLWMRRTSVSYFRTTDKPVPGLSNTEHVRLFKCRLPIPKLIVNTVITRNNGIERQHYSNNYAF